MAFFANSFVARNVVTNCETGIEGNYGIDEIDIIYVMDVIVGIGGIDVIDVIYKIYGIYVIGGIDVIYKIYGI